MFRHQNGVVKKLAVGRWSGRGDGGAWWQSAPSHGTPAQWLIRHWL